MAEKVLIAELDIDTGGVIKDQQQLGKEINALREQLRQAKKSGDEYSETNIKAAANLKSLTQQYNANQKILQGLQATQSGQIKTVAQAEKAITALNNEWKKSAQINGENDERTKKLGTDLTNLRGRYKELQQGVGNTAVNVGNYTESIQKALSETNALGGSLPQVARGANIVKTAFNLLAANPLIAVFLALAAAIRGVISIFAKNQEAVDKYNRIVKQLSATIAEITARIGMFFKAFKNLKDLNFKQFGQDVKASFTGIKESIQEATRAAGEIADLEVQIRRQNILTTEAIARRRKEMAELIILTRDESVSFEERQKALQRANELELANMNEQLALQRQRVRLQEMELAATPEFQRNDEQRLKIAEERAALFALEEQSINRQRELLNRVNELRNKELSVLKATTEEQRKLAEEQLKIINQGIDEELKLIEDQIARELEMQQEKFALEQEARLIDAENSRLLVAKTVLDEFTIRQQALNQQRVAEIVHAEKVGADVAKIKEKYDNIELQLETEKTKAKMDLASQFFGNLATIFGEQSKIGKAAAIIQTVIDTYKAAQSSYAALAGIPIVGPILGAAAAGAAIASGVSRINKIKSVNTNPNGSTPSVSAISNPSVSVPLPSTSGSNFSVGSSLGTSTPSNQTAASNSAAQAAAEIMASQPPVLVVEDYERVSERRVTIAEKSQL